MSNLNFGTYEDQLSLLNDSTYGYLLQDDLFIRDNLSNKVVKDLYIRNLNTWNQVKETYVYDQGQWKISYRKSYRFYIEISSTLTDFNLSSYLTSLSTPWDGISPVKGILKINSNGVVGSTNSSNAALTIPSLPINSSLVLVNEGSIYGQGGKGGDAPNGVGANGGDCIKISSQNSSNKIYYSGAGKLWAGGGGGGGGSENNLGYNEPFPGGFTRYGQGGGGGGGGQGYSTSSGGSGSSPPRNYGNAGQNGGNGGFSAPGNGGPGGSGNAGTSPERDPGGTGGNGATWGQIGQTAPAGADGPDDSSQYAPQGGAGGAGGFIINGSLISLVTIPTPVNGYLNTTGYKGRF